MADLKLPVNARIQATGSDLTEILADAVVKLDAFYGHRMWRITAVHARPLLQGLGAKVPEMWEADIEAEGDERKGTHGVQ